MDKFVLVDGLRTRYLESGEGEPVLLLHGASLGSSADVWERTLTPLAGHGFRAIAYDQPGFGLTDNPTDYSIAYRQGFILKLMDVLEIERAHLVGHSQAGAMVVGLSLERPERVRSAVVVGTGSLLPPLPEGQKSAGPREGDEGADAEPSLEDTRKLLEANLFDHALITSEVLAQRHRMSVGKNVEAFRARRQAEGAGAAKAAVPLWKRLEEVPVPLLLVYGRLDRASAAERAALAKERFPSLRLHVLDRCKHLVQWDAASAFLDLTVEFMKQSAKAHGSERAAAGQA